MSVGRGLAPAVYNKQNKTKWLWAFSAGASPRPTVLSAIQQRISNSNLSNRSICDSRCLAVTLIRAGALYGSRAFSANNNLSVLWEISTNKVIRLNCASYPKVFAKLFSKSGGLPSLMIGAIARFDGFRVLLFAMRAYKNFCVLMKLWEISTNKAIRLNCV